jgi:hypothetical protein
MKSDNSTTNPTDTVSASKQQGSKQVRDNKTARQFALSASIGVLIILLIAASSYYGIIRF